MVPSTTPATDPHPTETAADRARELAEARATSDESERALRLRVACEALAKRGLAHHAAEGLDSPTLLHLARGHVQALRVALRDGGDPTRYDATGAALTALGALWSVS